MDQIMLNASINGEAVQLDSQPTIAELLLQYLSRHKQDNKHVAVAVNGKFVPRSQYAQVYVNNDDDIDIVTAVGGG